MEIPGMQSTNDFDMIAFANKMKSNNMVEVGLSKKAEQDNTQPGMDTSISGVDFFKKSQDNSPLAESNNRLNAMLQMAMAGHDVSGVLDQEMGRAVSVAYEKVFDEIKEDIKTDAQEATSEDRTTEERASENKSSASVENQVSTDPEAQVSANAEIQNGPNAGEPTIETKGTPETASKVSETKDSPPPKPEKASIDIIV